MDEKRLQMDMERKNMKYIFLNRSKKKKKVIADKEQINVEEENRLGRVDFNIGNRGVQRQNRYIERSRDRYDELDSDRCGEMEQR